MFHEINRNDHNDEDYIIKNNICIILKSFIRIIESFINTYTRKYSYFYLIDFIKIFTELKKNINNEKLIDIFIRYFEINNINDDLIR